MRLLKVDMSTLKWNPSVFGAELFSLGGKMEEPRGRFCKTHPRRGSGQHGCGKTWVLGSFSVITRRPFKMTKSSHVDHVTPSWWFGLKAVWGFEPVEFV